MVDVDEDVNVGEGVVVVVVPVVHACVKEECEMVYWPLL